jgi:type VI protein secretion system component VasK
MARGATLQRIVQLVKAEARLNTSANAGLNAEEMIRTAIARTYEGLLRQHDWPHLIERTEITLAAGQYRYAIPATVEAERLFEEHAWVYYPAEDRRYPISAEEITFAHYNALDPDDTGGRLDPVRLWMLIPDEMIQVWPCPATSGGKLSFRGLRKVAQLVADADVCHLDDRLISLFVAAEIMGPEKGQPKLAQAQALLANLKGSLNKRRTFSMLGDSTHELHRPPRRLEVVYVRGA